MNTWKAGLCTLGLLLGVGCEPDAVSETTSDDVLASQSAELRSDALYFSARPDLRRCAAPACGGSFVRALNREQTSCADGSKAPECYVAELDLRRLGLSEERAQQLVREQRRVVLLGAIRPSARHGDGFGALVAEQAFRGVNETAAGATLLTTSSGIVCIKAPCPTHTGLLVNRGRRVELSPDLSALQASPPDLERVQRAFEQEGVLLSGRLAAEGSVASLAVTQAYLRVVTARKCGSRGLPECKAGSACRFDEGTCGELDHPGVCTPRPSFCTKIFKPVCGCDGETYGNDCVAAAAGVSVDHQGACEQPSDEEVVCGGIAPRPCPGAGECVFESTCPPGAKNCPVCSDCTGVCACSGAAVLCGPGTFFDDSPRVCSCVPLKK